MSARTAGLRSRPGTSTVMTADPADVPGTGPVWHVRAERLAQQVLGLVQDGTDALPEVSALEAVLRIEAGELPESAMEGYPFPGEEDESGCICPPDLLARGGYRGGCRVHALA
jgi:hypothetical protein